MPKKKSKKSGKLSKMTEEERIAYEENKRLAEEEMKKKKEDMLTQFLKDKLTKEERATKFNMNKLNHQWRNIMRESKSKELKKDIEILSQTFERIVDRKDATIKSLAKDLQEAEEQYAMALRSHLQNVDNLIDLQKERLETLHREYDEELAIVREEFDTERAIMVDQHNVENNDIADILFAMEQNFNEKEAEAKAEFHSLRDEIRNKDMEEKHGLRHTLQDKVENLWLQFKVALKNYNETTEERKTAFETLKKKDDESAKEIDTQMRRLQRISDQIAQLKGKMSANAKECEERNKQIKEEREKMLAHFQELKAQMNKMREGERDKLTKLTLESNASIKELKRQREKVESIMKVAEMCRKLETEEEKVLPFYATSLTKEEVEDVEAAILEQANEPLVQIMHEYTSLENFWKRFNKVMLDKLALDKEKQGLVQENQQLRTLLKQYLDGISVNDEILSQVNPLFIVNNKTNVKLNVPVMDPRVRRPVAQTVVEAAHVVKHVLHS
ncbi:coiled-coil domain-containing protein 65-like [Mizuhopecten yessoensis]|uniref:Dynein regulatory complex subunit 2 n=1 Tax=Mizuhopecten yessoensis TaxID=6573 RepID=A0A210Q1Q8_MIZYE|nr:coiled-coil domain-containing protein 65-like [Mizuhopecten yessoensis]OWF42683.1 Coiled-coil domain-containing protein 65 [Mizuhopecten yessoensis]